jgi:hypothetical protein
VTPISDSRSLALQSLFITQYYSHTFMLFLKVYLLNFRLQSVYIAYSSLYHRVEGMFFKLRHLADPTYSSLRATMLVYRLKNSLLMTLFLLRTIVLYHPSSQAVITPSCGIRLLKPLGMCFHLTIVHCFHLSSKNLVSKKTLFGL